MKKILILTSVLFVVTANVFAQAEVSKVYSPPQFPGGFKEFVKYAQQYINYPNDLIDKGITGVVSTTMYINKEGKVKFVNAVGDNILFNNETKRILKLSDKWIPAKKNGVVIDTMINFNVYFSLEKANPKATENDILILIYQESLNIADIKNLEAKEKEQAVKYENAVKLNEEGSLLLQSKKFEEALKKFNEAIEIGGKRKAFLYNRGLAYLNLKNDEKASADFLEAYRKGDVDAGKIYNDLFK